MVKEVSGHKKPKDFSAKDGDEIWIVFDIDDEIKDNRIIFESGIKLAQSKKLNLAWSNECFELWFLLHFQDLNSEIPRVDYHKKLKQFCKKEKESFEYHKNEEIGKLFEILKNKIPIAIKNARQIDTGDFTKNPSTKIYKIVEKLVNT